MGGGGLSKEKLTLLLNEMSEEQKVKFISNMHGPILSSLSNFSTP